MNIYTKDVAPLGFKGSDLMEDKWHHHYYAKFPKTCRVYIINSLDESVSHFQLTKKQYGDFEEGKLSLIPRGCCCATGNRYIENPVVDVEGDFDKLFGKKKAFLQYLEKLI
jgi:hypothetical protein